MAALVVRSATRLFVSTAAWLPTLIRLGARAADVTWLGVPSNLPDEVSAEALGGVRQRYAPGHGQQLIGHFGTFGALITPVLRQVATSLLARAPHRRMLLIGCGSEAVANRLARERPDIAGRVFATGNLPLHALPAHLGAVDLLIQPYADGVTTRRTSVMAGLALGIPTLTTEGDLTEACWRQQGWVGLVPAGRPECLIDGAERLLTDATARRDLARSGREAYITHFRLERTVTALRDDGEKSGRGSNGLLLGGQTP
jgi:hypothetical protein